MALLSKDLNLFAPMVAERGLTAVRSKQNCPVLGSCLQAALSGLAQVGQLVAELGQNIGSCAAATATAAASGAATANCLRASLGAGLAWWWRCRGSSGRPGSISSQTLDNKKQNGYLKMDVNKLEGVHGFEARVLNIQLYIRNTFSESI